MARAPRYGKALLSVCWSTGTTQLAVCWNIAKTDLTLMRDRVRKQNRDR